MCERTPQLKRRDTDRRRAGMVGRAVVAALFPVLACAGSAAVTTLVAQQATVGDAASPRAADARVAELHARFTRAVLNTDRHKARWKEAERLLASATITYTVRAGRIVIIARGDSIPPRTMEALRAGAQLAWTRIHTYLDSGASFVEGHPLEWRRYGSRGLGFRGTFAALGFANNVSRGQKFTATPSAADVANTIEDLYGSLAQNSAPPRLMAWARTSWIPLSPNTDSNWEEVSVALATSRTSVARSCRAGSIEQCVIALQLDKDSTVDRIHDWYAPDDLRSLVSEWAPKDSALHALGRTCVDTRSSAVCEQAATLMAVPQPLPNSVKTSLIAFALERGGEGSFTRMTGATGSAAQILAITAGISGDQLLSEWRAKAVAAKPPHSLPSPLEGATLLAWTAAFATLAMRRRI